MFGPIVCTFVFLIVRRWRHIIYFFVAIVDHTTQLWTTRWIIHTVLQLHYYSSFNTCLFTGLVITNPPQDNVVCVGDEVNITCGYNLSVQVILVWRINGWLFTASNIENSSSFESPSVTSGIDTVFVIYVGE